MKQPPDYLRDAARRAALALGALREGPLSPVGDGGDEALRAALEDCRLAVALIPEEEARARGLAVGAADEVERNAYLWQADKARLQIEQAARVAEERLLLLDSLKSEEDFRRETKKCAADTLHWFRKYAWGYDPRSPLKVQPFHPFPRQEDYISWLDETVLRRRKSGVVEKARDQGATVGALNWVCHKWLFVPGFSAFLSSATEDLVDSKKDPDTLFEKVRFQLRLTPSWMLPEGFDLRRDLTYMNLHNPQTGATISGGAPTENVGRQRRATVVIADEFQAWPNGGFRQNTALSMTSDSLIKLGTPYGIFNPYYRDTHAEGANVFVMDWRDHPWKDQRWYDSLPYGHVGPPMTAESIAQEVDRDYEASQPGKVIKNLREEYCFITWPELVAGFDAYKLGRHFTTPGGRYIIPEAWNWGRVSDFGESARTVEDTHIWAYTLFARPPEGWPFTDTVFVFCALPVEPIGCGEEEGFAFYADIERALGVRGDRGFLRAPEVSDFSHEATDAKRVLADKFGEEWYIPDLDFDKGRRKLIYHFNLTDTREPNPWRPELTGRARIAYVAPPGEYRLARRPGEGRHYVTPSKSQFGFKRLRAEFAAWHYPPEEQGKAVPRMRPKAVFDDIVTTQRYMAARYGVEAARLSDWGRLLARIPERLRPENVLAQKGTPAFPELAAEAAHALRRAELQKKREDEEWSKAWARAVRRPVRHRLFRRNGRW